MSINDSRNNAYTAQNGIKSSIQLTIISFLPLEVNRIYSTSYRVEAIVQPWKANNDEKGRVGGSRNKFLCFCGVVCRLYKKAKISTVLLYCNTQRAQTFWRKHITLFQQPFFTQRGFDLFSCSLFSPYVHRRLNSPPLHILPKTLLTHYRLRRRSK